VYDISSGGKRQREASRLPLGRKQCELEEEVEVSPFNRPNAERICWEWSRVTELWEGATDEEREELMQAMVIRVEMDEKEEGTCEVALMPQVPCLASDWLGLTSRMGAGRSHSLNRLPSTRCFGRQRRCGLYPNDVHEQQVTCLEAVASRE
jgi:hypothetical protein